MELTGFIELDMVRERREKIAKIRATIDEEDANLAITEKTLEMLQSRSIQETTN